MFVELQKQLKIKKTSISFTKNVQSSPLQQQKLFQSQKLKQQNKSFSSSFSLKSSKFKPLKSKSPESKSLKSKSPKSKSSTTKSLATVAKSVLILYKPLKPKSLKLKSPKPKPLKSESPKSKPFATIEKSVLISYTIDFENAKNSTNLIAFKTIVILRKLMLIIITSLTETTKISILKKSKSIIINVNFKLQNNFIYYVKNDVFRFCIPKNC